MNGRFAPPFLEVLTVDFPVGFVLCALNFFALSNLSPKAFAAGFLAVACVSKAFCGAAFDCTRAFGVALRALGFGERAAFGSSAGINADAADPIKWPLRILINASRITGQPAESW